jgi:hypothetical protein
MAASERGVRATCHTPRFGIEVSSILQTILGSSLDLAVTDAMSLARGDVAHLQ